MPHPKVYQRATHGGANWNILCHDVRATRTHARAHTHTRATPHTHTHTRTHTWVVVTAMITAVCGCCSGAPCLNGKHARRESTSYCTTPRKTTSAKPAKPGPTKKVPVQQQRVFRRRRRVPKASNSTCTDFFGTTSARTAPLPCSNPWPMGRRACPRKPRARRDSTSSSQALRMTMPALTARQDDTAQATTARWPACPKAFPTSSPKLV